MSESLRPAESTKQDIVQPIRAAADALVEQGSAEFVKGNSEAARDKFEAAIRTALGPEHTEDKLRITYGTKNKVVLSDIKPVAAKNLTPIAAREIVDAAFKSAESARTTDRKNPMILVQAVGSDKSPTTLLRQDIDKNGRYNSQNNTLPTLVKAVSTVDKSAKQPSKQAPSSAVSEVSSPSTAPAQPKAKAAPPGIESAPSVASEVSSPSTEQASPEAETTPSRVEATEPPVASEVFLPTTAQTSPRVETTRSGVESTVVSESSTAARQAIQARLSDLKAAIDSVQKNLKAPSPEARFTLNTVRAGISSLPTRAEKAVDAGIKMASKGTANASKFSAKASAFIHQAAEGISRGGNWAAERMAKVSNNRAASALIEAVKKGEARAPGHREFKLGEYSVARTDENRFMVSKGKTPLMTYSVNQDGKPAAIESFKPYDYVDLKETVRSTAVVKTTSPKFEKRHAQASEMIANVAAETVTALNGKHQLGQTLKSSGKSVNILIDSKGTLTITSKQPGRGVLLTKTPEGEVTSNMTPADIKRFENIVRAHQQPVDKVADGERSPKIEVGAER